MQKFQLVSMAAFFMACKLHEIHIPHISILVDGSSKKYSAKDILDMEANIIITLCFNLNFPT